MLPTILPRHCATGAFAIALMLTLAGCLGYVDQPRHRSARVVQPVLVEEEYVYYPSYQVYYGSRSHQYYYQEGSSWVARPAPATLSVSVLLSSPSVPMAFHDAPAAHHAQVIQTYPTTWSQSHGNQRAKRHDRAESRDENRNER
jgi:hypothetical protein